MLANYLMLVSALIMATLGSAHWLLTYRGPKLLPRDRTLKEAMMQTSPVITTQTTMWRAWIGFNVSHSLGAILFGLVYGYLGWVHGELLFHSWFLLLVGLIMLLTYFVLAMLYWFITPILGIGLSLICFVLSIVVSRL